MNDYIQVEGTDRVIDIEYRLKDPEPTGTEDQQKTRQRMLHFFTTRVFYY